jgi:hypothetical protein
MRWLTVSVVIIASMLSLLGLGVASYREFKYSNAGEVVSFGQARVLASCLLSFICLLVATLTDGYQPALAGLMFAAWSALSLRMQVRIRPEGIRVSRTLTSIEVPTGDIVGCEMTSTETEDYGTRRELFLVRRDASKIDLTPFSNLHALVENIPGTSCSLPETVNVRTTINRWVILLCAALFFLNVILVASGAWGTVPSNLH